MRVNPPANVENPSLWAFRKHEAGSWKLEEKPESAGETPAAVKNCGHRRNGDASD
jgi:hypothetical protein